MYRRHIILALSQTAKTKLGACLLESISRAVGPPWRTTPGHHLGGRVVASRRLAAGSSCRSHRKEEVRVRRQRRHPRRRPCARVRRVIMATRSRACRIIAHHACAPAVQAFMTDLHRPSYLLLRVAACITHFTRAVPCT